MIIFLYGPDDYRRREREKFYILEFQKKYSGLSVERFELLEVEGFYRFLEFSKANSLFAIAKMAVVENVFANEIKGLSDLLKSLAKTGPETTVLVLEGKSPPKEFEFLKKQAKVLEEFGFLDGSLWRDFVAKKAKEHDAKLTSGALQFLAEAYRGDTWGLITELQKLRFVGHSPIDKNYLEEQGLDVPQEFFPMLYGLRSPNQRARLAALERIFVSGEPAQRIFYTLAYSWSEKLHDFARYDLLIKSGKLDCEEALLDAVL